LLLLQTRKFPLGANSTKNDQEFIKFILRVNRTMKKLQISISELSGFVDKNQNNEAYRCKEYIVYIIHLMKILHQSRRTSLYGFT
jgi:hypothetical protein